MNKLTTLCKKWTDTSLVLRKNPYPLLFTCLKESGLNAFFTRSSAANIPINMNLCKKLGLAEYYDRKKKQL